MRDTRRLRTERLRELRLRSTEASLLEAHPSQGLGSERWRQPSQLAIQPPRDSLTFPGRSWHHHCTSGDLSTAECLIGSLGFGKRIPPRDKRFESKRSLFGEAQNFGHIRTGSCSVRPDDSQAASNKSRNFHRSCRASGGNTDSDHATAVTQQFHRLRKRLRTSENFECNIDTTA